MYAGVGMFVFDHFLRYISLSLSLSSHVQVLETKS